MKKYFLFTSSFVVLFVVVFFVAEIVSGLYLTALYTPNIDAAWASRGALAQEAGIVGRTQSFIMPLFIGVIAAIGAYTLTEKLVIR